MSNEKYSQDAIDFAENLRKRINEMNDNKQKKEVKSRKGLRFLFSLLFSKLF